MMKMLGARALRRGATEGKRRRENGGKILGDSQVAGKKKSPVGGSSRGSDDREQRRSFRVFERRKPASRAAHSGFLPSPSSSLSHSPPNPPQSPQSTGRPFAEKARPERGAPGFRGGAKRPPSPRGRAPGEGAATRTGTETILTSQSTVVLSLRLGRLRTRSRRSPVPAVASGASPHEVYNGSPSARDTRGERTEPGSIGQESVRSLYCSSCHF
jgi:hypothetical protein